MSFHLVHGIWLRCPKKKHKRSERYLHLSSIAHIARDGGGVVQMDKGSFLVEAVNNERYRTYEPKSGIYTTFNLDGVQVHQSVLDEEAAKKEAEYLANIADPNRVVFTTSFGDLTEKIDNHPYREVERGLNSIYRKVTSLNELYNSIVKLVMSIQDLKDQESLTHQLSFMLHIYLNEMYSLKEQSKRIIAQSFKKTNPDVLEEWGKESDTLWEVRLKLIKAIRGFGEHFDQLPVSITISVTSMTRHIVLLRSSLDRDVRGVAAILAKSYEAGEDVPIMDEISKAQLTIQEHWKDWGPRFRKLRSEEQEELELLREEVTELVMPILSFSQQEPTA